MYPDLIILNGKAVTFNANQPEASALAVEGGRIVAVGNSTDIRSLAQANTRIIDAEEGSILPGFIDSHVHLFGGAVELEYLDLYGVYGLQQLTKTVQDWSKTCLDDAIVFAVNADYNIVASGHSTTRHDLDEVISDRPFAMFAADHHTIWANTKALELTGLLSGGSAEKRRKNHDVH